MNKMKLNTILTVTLSTLMVAAPSVAAFGYPGVTGSVLFGAMATLLITLE